MNYLRSNGALVDEKGKEISLIRILWDMDELPVELLPGVILNSTFLLMEKAPFFFGLAIGCPYLPDYLKEAKQPPKPLDYGDGNCALAIEIRAFVADARLRFDVYALLEHPADFTRRARPLRGIGRGPVAAASGHALRGRTHAGQQGYAPWKPHLHPARSSVYPDGRAQLVWATPGAGREPSRIAG